MRHLMAVVSLLALLGCATEGDISRLPVENVDASYKKKTLRWSGTFGGSTSTYYIKAFNKDGMIALCGVRVGEQAGVADDLADVWFEGASVYIGRRGNRIASARFIGAVEPDTPRDKMEAYCIKTTTPAEDTVIYQPIGLVGGAIEIW